jgi:hypothetical protein
VLVYSCVLMPNEDLSLPYCKNQQISILYKGNQSTYLFNIKITHALHKYCNYKTHSYKIRSPASCAHSCWGHRSNGMLPDILVTITHVSGQPTTEKAFLILDA